MAKKSSFWGKLWNDIKKGFSIGRSKTRNRKKTRAYSKPSKKVEQSRRTAARSVTNTVRSVINTVKHYANQEPDYGTVKTTSPSEFLNRYNRAHNNYQRPGAEPIKGASFNEESSIEAKVREEAQRTTWVNNQLLYNPATMTLVKTREDRTKERLKDNPYNPSLNLDKYIEYENALLNQYGVNSNQQEVANEFIETYTSKKSDYIFDPTALDNWYLKNTVERKGKRELVDNPDVLLPTARVDGRTITQSEISNIKKNWRAVYGLESNKKYRNYQAEQEELRNMTADFSDSKSANSFIDVIVDAVTGKESFIEGMDRYINRYFKDPLSKGQFGIAGLNLLVNVSEVTDVFGRTARSFFTGPERVYTGSKGSYSYYKNNKDSTWVADGISKSDQAKIISIIRSLNTSTSLNYGDLLTNNLGNRESQILAAMENAGLLKEYRIFKREYNKWKKEGKGSLEARAKHAKDTLLSKEPYIADSGSAFNDMAVEMISDPLLVGSIFTGAFRAGTKAAVKNSAKAALRRLDLDDINNGINPTKFATVRTNTKEGVALAKSEGKLFNRVTSRFSREVEDHLLDISDKRLDKEITTLTENLRKLSIIRDDQIENFARYLKDELLWARSNKLGVTVKSTSKLDSVTGKSALMAKKADDVLNAVDGWLLKGSLLVPYLPYKLGQASYKKITRGSLKSKIIHNEFWQRMQSKVDPERYAYNRSVDAERSMKKGAEALDYYEVTEELFDDTIGKSDGDLTALIAQQLSTKSRQKLAELKKYIKSLDDSDESLALTEDAIIKSVRSSSNNEVSTLEDYLTLVNKLVEEQPEFESLANDLDQLIKDVTAKFGGDYLSSSKLKELSKPVYKNIEDKVTIRDSEKTFDDLSQFPSDSLKNYPIASSYAKVVADSVITAFRYVVFSKIDPKPFKLFFKRLDIYDFVTYFYENLTKDASLKFVDDLTGRLNNVPIDQLWAAFDDLSKYFEDFLNRMGSEQTLVKMLPEGSKLPSKDTAELLANYNKVYKQVSDIVSKLSIFKKSLYEASLFRVSETTQVIEMFEDTARRNLELVKDKSFQKLINTIKNPEGPLGKYFDEAVYYMKAFTSDPNTDFVLQKVDSEIIEEAYSIYEKCYSENTLDSFFYEFNEYLLNNNYTLLSDYFSKFVDRTNIDPLAFLHSLQARANQTSGDKALLVALKHIYTEAEAAELYTSAIDILSNNAEMSNLKVNAVIDALNGVRNRIPSNYIDKAGKPMDDFIKKVQLTLRSSYGTESVSLDNLRKRYLDWRNPAYKQFGEEIQDKNIRARIESLLKGGHLDPADDVRVQMFFSILENPDCVAKYNSYEQPVFFTDIETTGLNDSFDQVLSIATKEWDKDALKEGYSLSDVLDAVTSNKDMKTYRTFTDEDVLASKLDDNLLDVFYKNNDVKVDRYANLRAARLKDFNEHYGLHSKLNTSGVEVTELDIIQEFLNDMDSIAYENLGVQPKLVFHNANDFDTGFLHSKIKDNIDYKGGLKLYHGTINDLFRASDNTLRDLISQQGDVLLTYKDITYIKEWLSNYVKKLKLQHIDFKTLDLTRLKKSCLVLHNALKNSDWSKLPFDDQTSVLTRLKQDPDAYDALVEILDYETGTFAKLRNTQHKLGLNGSNILFNPFSRKSVSAPDYINDVFDETEQYIINKLREDSSDSYDHIIEMFSYIAYTRRFDVGDANLIKRIEGEINKLKKGGTEHLRERLDAVPPIEGLNIALMNVLQINDGGLPYYGFKYLFDGYKVSHYFDLDSMGYVSRFYLDEVQDFAKDLNKSRSMLKNNNLLNEHLEDFQNIIKFIQISYIKQLNKVDPLKYLEHLKIPNSAAEAYLIAQKLYDIFNFKLTKVDATSTFEDSLYYKLQAVANQKNQKAIDILNNTNALYHYRIYKYQDPPNSAKFDPSAQGHLNDSVVLRNAINDVETGDKDLTDISNTFDDVNPSLERVKHKQVSEAHFRDLEMLESIHNGMESADRDKLVSAYRDKQLGLESVKSYQILDSFASSEKNLIGHLLHLSPIVIIPRKGSEPYMKLLNKLEQALPTYNSNFIYYNTIDSDQYLVISIKAEAINDIVMDSGAAGQTPTGHFVRATGEYYHKPDYKHLDKTVEYASNIPIHVSGTVIFTNAVSYINKYITDQDKNIARLTNNRNAGSTNTLMTKAQFNRIYENLPSSIQSEILPAYSLEKLQFQYGAAFDFSLLGEYGNKWFLDNTSDTDMLLSYVEVNKILINHTKDEALFIHNYFSGYQQTVLKELFDQHSTDEILEWFDINPEMVGVVVKDGKSNTGFIVELVTIKTKKDLDYLLENNGIVEHYSDAKAVQRILNAYTSSSDLYKVYSRFVVLNKAIQLSSSLKTPIVNTLDALLKGYLSTGSPDAFTRNIPKAIATINQYRKLRNYIDVEHYVYYKSIDQIKKEWKQIQKQAGKNVTMSFKNYCLLDGWFKDFELSAANNADIAKELKAKGEAFSYETKVLRKNGIDTSGLQEDWIVFKQLPEQEVRKRFRKLPPEFSKRYFDEDTFVDIHKGDIGDYDEATLIKYKDVVNAIILNTRKGKKAKKLFNKIIVPNTVNDWINLFFTPLNKGEEVIRLAQLFTLLELGEDMSTAFRNIEFSQFDQSARSHFDVVMEGVMPFYTYEKNNFLFWTNLIIDSPRLLRVFEHVYSQLSWNFDDYDLDEVSSNYTLQNLMLSGNLKLFEYDKYREVWTNLNPSFMGTFKWLYSPFNTAYSKLWTPWRAASGELFRAFGMDLKFVLGESYEDAVFEDQQSWLLKLKDISSKAPFFKELAKLFETAARNIGLLGAESYSDVVLKGYRAFPSLFTVYTDYTDVREAEYELYASELLKDGLWRDSNTGAKVDLFYKYNKGLNEPSLSFKEKAALYKAKGLYHDKNQDEWVALSDYIPLGLNEKFRFKKKEGDWERWVKLNEFFFGKTWDANIRKLVNIGEVSEGGLNSENLTWEEIQMYTEMYFDEVWDANQGEFVAKENYIAGGLNRDDLSWSEVVALNRAIHGTVWDNEQQEWVKVGKPTVKIADYLKVEKKSEFSIDNMLNFDNILYNKVTYDLLRSGIDYKKYKNTLTGNPEHDQKIFDQILSTVDTSSSRWDYYSGSVWPFRFSKQYPYPETSTNQYFRTPSIGDSLRSWVRSGHKRMSVYDKYYTFEYNALYTTLDQPRARSYYPDHYFNKSTLSKELAVDRYAKGLYYSNRYPSLSSVTKRTMLENYKAMVWS